MEDMIHRYVKKPDNIRQIGESPYSGPVYIEDYVMTYIRQVFKEQGEEKIILMLGKKGEEAAKDSIFIYGAISMGFKVTDAVTDISEKDWSEAYEKIYRYFPGAELLGWVCGVYMWNSKVDATINIIHRKYFSKEDNILFLFDLSECEEKIFKWRSDNLKEQTGYYVYYEKNPQMQDFVLGENQSESVDESYEDEVTEAIRETINKNEKKESGSKTVLFVLAMATAAMFIVGGNYMIESFTKISSLEDSVDVLQGYVTTTYGNEKRENVTGSGIKIKEESAAGKININKKEAEKNLKEKQTLAADEKKADGRLKIKKRNEVIRKKSNRSNMKTVKDKRRINRSNRKINIKNHSDRRYETYKVKKGDTLSMIVWKQYHTLKKISLVKNVNKIKDCDSISEGQVIKLPVR